ncbi:hypothetical protein [Brachyspira murdochii]|uniref:Uncharacterized protein n=1 Tax=Brachyspira murdochii (strain ATCC 51284 / DSM 12563 / 56-150) TaxID=526224 RepID=D5U9R0_BRAM5|nr:hypothetical protein [Brachyspira murdochii]ADG71433.1 hypothetical protein Bmur_1343 [Brachyspira murdochii DSM 12563]
MTKNNIIAENTIEKEENNNHYNDALIPDDALILNDEKEYKSLIDEYNDIIKEGEMIDIL